MSDSKGLVERLRDDDRVVRGNVLGWQILDEAADEIERLVRLLDNAMRTRAHELTYIDEVLHNISKQAGEGARESAWSTLGWLTNRRMADPCSSPEPSP